MRGINSINTLYAGYLVKHGFGHVISSENKDGFILNVIRYVDSDGNERYGKFRERRFKNNINIDRVKLKV